MQDSPIIRFMLSVFCSKMMIKSVRCLGLGALLAALPLCVAASTVTVDFSIALNGLDGTGEFTYDPTMTATDGLGGYADPANGLDSFSLTYNGTTYTNTSASLLDPAALPAVFLPGNSSVPSGLQYGFLALWVVNGSCSGSGGSYTCNDATILGLGRSPGAFLTSNVTTATISFSGSELRYNLGAAPDVSQIVGSITGESVVTPEPSFFPLTAIALAGLWFARRRKAIL